MEITLELEHTIRNIANFPTPGVQFKDITPVLANPALLRQTIDLLAEPFLEDRITKVVAIEARGFILGGMLAHRLGAGFIPVRKKGKLPYETIEEAYALEYGAGIIEMHADALAPGDRVLIHDDVIATGGTAAASCRLAQRAGAEVVACAFLIELGFLNGRNALDPQMRVYSVLHF